MFPGLCYLFRHPQMIKRMLFAWRHVSHVVGVSGTAARLQSGLLEQSFPPLFQSKSTPWSCLRRTPSPSARTALIYIGGKQRDLRRQDHRNVTIAKGAECRKEGGI